MPRQKKISALVVSAVLLLVIGIAGTTQAQDTNKNINNQDLFTILGGLNQGITDLQLYLQTNNLGQMAEGNLGAIGEKKLEDYLPIVKYNEGLYTALPIVTSDAVYLTSDSSTGIRSSGGIVQYLQSGTWSAIGGSTPGDEGWLANAANTAIYPSTNISGEYYRVLIAGNATTTPATTDTYFYVANSKEALFSGAVNASSTLGVTGAAKLYSTLAVTGAVTNASTLTVTGATTLSSTLALTGAATFASTLELAGTASTTGSAVLKSATINSDTGAISFTNENLSTTGTLASGALTVTGAATVSTTLGVTGATTLSDTLGVTGATTLSNTLAVSGAVTMTSGLTVDTDTLKVDATNNGIGVGTTTPTVSGSRVALIDDLLVFDGTSPYDKLVRIYGYAGDDDGGIAIFANNATTTALLSNTTSYITGGTLGIGTTTSVAELSILEATNPQLRLAYDGTNYGDWTVGSGGDLTIALSGGDISFSDENLVTTGTFGAATTTISSGDLVVDTNALIVKYLENRVGIGTTTPTYALSITDTGTQIGIAYDGTNYGTLAVGSGGDLTITATGGDISFSNENLATTGTLAAATTTVSLGDFTVGTTDFYVDDDNARVGIASGTPMSTLSIGTAGATSTISTGRFCQYVEDQIGRKYWVTLNLSAASASDSIFATSTTPCNQ